MGWGGLGVGGGGWGGFITDSEGVGWRAKFCQCGVRGIGGVKGRWGWKKGKRRQVWMWEELRDEEINIV